MPTDPNTLVVIAGDLCDPEATALVEYLRERGIEARLWGAHVGRLFGPCGLDAMQLVARQADEFAAREAVSVFRTGRPAVPAIVTENQTD